MNISISGGIDSSLIAAYISQQTDSYELISTNCVGKDRISNNLRAFQPYFKNKIQTIHVSEKQWCENLLDTYKIIRMPLPSHNFCTKLIQAKELSRQGIKINFGGEAADELFGGYSFYNFLTNSKTNSSPYSSYLNLPIDHSWDGTGLYNHLDKVWKRAYDKVRDTLLATSFTDMYIEVADDGLRNGDQIFGWHGIENRSPFVRKEVLKFALNLPQQFKRGKPLLINLFKKYFPSINVAPKQGFAGFPNEAKKYYKKPYNRFNMLSTLNITAFKQIKEIKWKLLNMELFYECCNSRYINNPIK